MLSLSSGGHAGVASLVSTLAYIALPLLAGCHGLGCHSCLRIDELTSRPKEKRDHPGLRFLAGDPTMGFVRLRQVKKGTVLEQESLPFVAVLLSYLADAAGPRPGPRALHSLRPLHSAGRHDGTLRGGGRDAGLADLPTARGRWPLRRRRAPGGWRRGRGGRGAVGAGVGGGVRHVVAVLLGAVLPVRRSQGDLAVPGRGRTLPAAPGRPTGGGGCGCGGGGGGPATLIQ